MFVVYPEAVAKMPVSQIWAVMFFCMLFSVGLGSQVMYCAASWGINVLPPGD